MNFGEVEKIAAAILYEGYILYPYRSTAIKNRQRWNFGTLYPREYAEAQRPPEPYSFKCECLVEPGREEPRVDLRIRFLQLLPPDAADDAAEDASLCWNTGVERTAEQSGLRMEELASSPLCVEVEFAGELRGRLHAGATALDQGGYRVRIEWENVSAWKHGGGPERGRALAQSFVSTHMLLGVSGGAFVSLLDPPDRYAEAAAGCENRGVFPVLAGEEGQREIVLASPIILYDYPRIAPESAGDFFDSTEMDEMLALRVLTLTDAEKQEMQRLDPRARLILERTEALSGEQMLKVHGAVRGLRQLAPEPKSAERER